LLLPWIQTYLAHHLVTLLYLMGLIEDVYLCGEMLREDLSGNVLVFELVLPVLTE
jgi:hypothetical protein